MEPVRDTPFEFGFLQWQVRPPQPSLTVVVKGTFELKNREPSKIAATQIPCGGDVYHDDDEELSLRYENDFAILKPRGECFVVGSCFVARGREATEMPVGFRIGNLQKGFQVIGDRIWNQKMLRAKPSDPRPFKEMPLRAERAFGGPGHKTNPWGVGYKGFHREELSMLPNIERVDARVTAPGSKVEPLICSPQPMNARNRMRYTGTYDARWQKDRWPWFPEDFQWEYYLSSPEDQRIDGYWKGDEPITLMNLHREHSRLETSLPSLVPRAFLHTRKAEVASDLTEIGLKLDTITINTDIGCVICIWRGITEISTEDLDEIDHLFITHEHSTANRSHQALYSRMHQRIKEEEDWEVPEEEQAPGPLLPLNLAGLPDRPLDATTFASVGMPRATQPEVEVETVDVSVAEVMPDPQQELELASTDAQLKAYESSVQDIKFVTVDPDPDDVRKQLEAAPFDVPESVIEGMYEVYEPPPPDEPEEYVEEPEADERTRFFAILQSGASFEGEAFEDLDLTNVDLRGRDLSYIIMERVDLSGANLTKANLTGAQLNECLLRGACLDEVTMQYTDFSGCNAQGATFRRAYLVDAMSDESFLADCDFREVNAQGATFVESNLTKATFKSSNLKNADFAEAILEDVDFSSCVLIDASIIGSKAKNTLFDDSDLTNFRAGEGADLTMARFSNVKAKGSFWEESNLQKAIFARSELDDAFFSGATLTGASLDFCSIRWGRFDNADLTNATLRQTNLFEAIFESANLSYSDFQGSNLFGAETWKAVIDGARFDLANLKRTKISWWRA